MTGAVGAQIYNNSATAVTGLVYDVTLPHAGDSDGSQWTATLERAPLVATVSGSTYTPDLTATVLYSSDGVNYGPAPAGYGGVTHVRVTIPSIAPHTQYGIGLSLRAPATGGSRGFEQTGRLSSTYTKDGIVYRPGKKKMMFVDGTDTDGDGTIDIYDPDDDGDGCSDANE